METKYYVFGNDGVTYYLLTDDYLDEDGVYNGDDSVVTVTEVSPNRFRLECDDYYSKDGSLILEITKPLDRALRTYMALLNADSEMDESFTVLSPMEGRRP